MQTGNLKLATGSRFVGQQRRYNGVFQRVGRDMYIAAPVIIPTRVIEIREQDVTPHNAAIAGGVSVASEKIAAVKVFKGGTALLAAGAIAAAATLFVSGPFLPGVSAILTVVGGTIAAGATERYRRGK